MKTKIIDEITFENFVKQNSFFNFFESNVYIDYLKITKQKYKIIGIYNNDVLKAASIILIKKITFSLKYIFMPKGFIMNYSNIEDIPKIIESIKKFFDNNKYVFIKISPEIISSNINYKDKIKNINLYGKKICEIFENNGFVIPTYYNYFNKYNAFINLNNFNVDNLDEITKIRLFNLNDTLSVRPASINDIKYFNLTSSEINFYKKYSQKHSYYLDYLIFEIDYNIYLKLLNNEYNAEIENNNIIIKKFKENISDESLFNIKMISDNKLQDLKNEIISITRLLANENNLNKKIVIGSTITSKYVNKVCILKLNCGLNNSNINENYYLLFLLILYYKKLNFILLDLNGIDEKSILNNQDDYKLSFKPIIYEYIPEYDLVLNKKYYDFLKNNNFKVK